MEDMTEFFVLNLHPDHQGRFPQLGHAINMGLDILAINVLAGNQLIPSLEGKNTVCPFEVRTEGRPDFVGGCATSEFR